MKRRSRRSRRGKAMRRRFWQPDSVKSVLRSSEGLPLTVIMERLSNGLLGTSNIEPAEVQWRGDGKQWQS